MKQKKKQKNLIIVAITVLCAVFLCEAYIHIQLKNSAAAPFIILGILLLAAAFVVIQKELAAYLKHKETMEKESRDNLYRLLESRLYNIERYQKAIYNEAKSVRINTEELALNRELSAPSAAPVAEENNLADLNEGLKKNMERVAKAVIKHSREDNERLVEQLQEIGRQMTAEDDSMPADDPSLEVLEQLLRVCENGFRSLSDMAVHNDAAVFPEGNPTEANVPLPAKDALAEDDPMDVLSTDFDTTEEEDIPDTGLDAILGETVLEEEPSDIENLVTESPVTESLAADALTAEEPEIEELEIEEPEIEEPVEESLEDLPSGEKNVEELMELISKDDTPPAGDILDDTLNDDLNRQLTPEEVSAMFAGSEPVPKASETAPVEAIDSNRQLTPEEIAAMFSSMEE